MTNNRLNQLSQSLSWNGFRNSGDPPADIASPELINDTTTLTIVRRFVIQRPGAAIVAGLVVGGMLGWLISRKK